MLLAIVRIVLIILLSIIICLFGLIYCLFNPRNPQHVATFGRLFGRMAPIFGIKLKIRLPKTKHLPQNCIYIANHQNYYDMVTVSYIVPSRTVTVGKSSILWIPLFGQLYWLTGNLLIKRDQITYSYHRLIQFIHSMKKRNISIWIFPEGTRNRGRGLLPFKTGAFYAAITAKIPIVPICISNTTNKIKLNRWSNGIVIIEMLPPINIQESKSNNNKTQVRQLTQYCHTLMKNKLHELNTEVTKYESDAQLTR